MNKKSYFLVGLTCIIAGSLILFGCGRNEKSPVESEVEATGELNIAISNAPINAAAAKAYVYATDMNDTITASLTLNDTMVTGTISGIPVGSDRTLKIEVMDDTGTVIYEGIETGITVTRGQYTKVSVALKPATGGIAVDGTFEPDDQIDTDQMEIIHSISALHFDPTADFEGDAEYCVLFELEAPSVSPQIIASVTATGPGGEKYTLQDVEPGGTCLAGTNEPSDSHYRLTSRMSAAPVPGTYTFTVVFTNSSFMQVTEELIKEEIQEGNTDYDCLLGTYIGRAPSQSGLASLIGIGIIPVRTGLYQNYPNPVNPETWIPFDLVEGSEVSLYIYATLTGELIRTIDLGTLEAGSYTCKNRAIYWDGRDEAGHEVPCGIYIYQLRAGDFTTTKKMSLMR